MYLGGAAQLFIKCIKGNFMHHFTWLPKPIQGTQTKITYQFWYLALQ